MTEIRNHNKNYKFRYIHLKNTIHQYLYDAAIAILRGKLISSYLNYEICIQFKWKKHKHSSSKKKKAKHYSSKAYFKQANKVLDYVNSQETEN